MKHAIGTLMGMVALAALCGCASQVSWQKEYYEPTDETMTIREDGLKVGALKAEAVKEGQPDWSSKSLSIISIGK